MNLGTFSVSLAVKDIKASLAFYQKLGFKTFGGEPAPTWAILKNGDTVIGLFQGMFEKNILTFNPGWDSDRNTLPDAWDEEDGRLYRPGCDRPPAPFHR